MQEKIVREFGAKAIGTSPPPITRPGEAASVIVTLHDRRWMTTFRWGLIPRWAATAGGLGQLHARAETLTDKASFRDKALFQACLNLRRCIIPMTEYDQGVSVAAMGAEMLSSVAKVRRPDRALMGVAGIWDEWRPPDRSTVQRTFATVTVPAIADVSKIHDRMPAILEKGDYDLWLNTDVDNARDLMPLLRPYQEPLEVVLPKIRPQSQQDKPEDLHAFRLEPS